MQKQYITDGEYRYFSPVFLFDPVTGDVLDLQMGALTNNPAYRRHASPKRARCSHFPTDHRSIQRGIARETTC
ncbi:phage protease [Pseudomonas aeruginosa]|uniref:phage protease n=1 Tax=Pseudomonas aeruginosa TaxID=287 RepID=UPI003D01F5A6